MSDSTGPASGPPRGTGPLLKREARLAWGLLFPTLAIVSAVVVLPLLAIFWISFKPIGLADLRPPAPVVRKACADRATISACNTASAIPRNRSRSRALPCRTACPRA